MKSEYNQKQSGVTLVEILVVIVIMSILTTLLIPRLRTVTKDRNIREAARKVGAIFAKASQNAVVDGAAGVYFERNPNFVYSPPTNRGLNGQPIRVPFAATSMFLMRTVPPWSGDFVGDTADVDDMGQIIIPRPIDHNTLTDDKRFIDARDVIYLNNRSFGYQIKSYVEFNDPPNNTIRYPNGKLTLTVEYNDPGDFTSSAPRPERAEMIPFRVERLPRKVESSKVNLPDGYLVNLRYSGPVDLSGNFPETVLSAFKTTDDVFAAFYFGSGGKFRFLRTGAGFDTCSNPMPTIAPEEDRVNPQSALFFFVTEDDLNLKAGQDQLQDAENLWVTVGLETGNVNIAYNNPRPAPVIDPSTQEERPIDFLARLTAARGIARTNQTASQ